jgi:hypothetical protein
VPLLDWLAATATETADDAPPLCDLDAEQEACNDLLTEPVERMRQRWKFAAHNAGLERLLARYQPYGPDPPAVPPLEPEHAFMVQALARLRRQYERRTVRFWGHYRRPGTEQELRPVPFAPRVTLDLQAIRLQLLGDPDWWCSLEVENRSSATPDATPPTPVTSSEPGSSELDWREVVDHEMQWRKGRHLLQGGVVKLAKCLHAWLQRHGIKAPEAAKTVEHHIRPYFQKHGEPARRGPRPRGN